MIMTGPCTRKIIFFTRDIFLNMRPYHHWRGHRTSRKYCPCGVSILHLSIRMIYKCDNLFRGPARIFYHVIYLCVSFAWLALGLSAPIMNGTSQWANLRVSGLFEPLYWLILYITIHEICWNSFNLSKYVQNGILWISVSVSVSGSCCYFLHVV